MIYCRVSTKEQVEEGNSLVTQERLCREYILKNNYLLDKVFIEQGESAKTANRTELKNLLTYCSNKKNGIKAVIIYKLDRISRNTDDYSQIRLLLKRGGVEIKSITEYFENNPVGRFMENTMANIAQFDNDVRTERSVNGMKEAVREGRYVWKAPIGYQNTRISGKATISIHPIYGPIIKKGFELVAKNTDSVNAIYRQLVIEGFINTKGKPFSLGHFYLALREELYFGKIRKFGEIQKGTFTPLITEDLFRQVQRVLDKRTKIQRDRKVLDPDFPLRRLIYDEENRRLTGSWSKGKYNWFSYYRFGKTGKSHPTALMDSKFKEFLNTFSIDRSVVALLKKLIEEKYKEITKTNSNLRTQLLTEITNLENRKSLLVKKNLDGIISDSIYVEQVQIFEENLNELKQQLYRIPDGDSQLKEIGEKTEEYLKSPGNVWEKLPIDKKVPFQEFHFSDGILFENNSYRTPKKSLFDKIKVEIESLIYPKVNFSHQNPNLVELPNNLNGIESPSLNELLIINEFLN